MFLERLGATVCAFFALSWEKLPFCGQKLTQEGNFWVQVGLIGHCWLAWRDHFSILRVPVAAKEVVGKLGATRYTVFALSW